MKDNVHFIKAHAFNTRHNDKAEMVLDTVACVLKIEIDITLA